MFAPLCRLRSIATRSPVAGATVSFQEKVNEWGRGAAYAFYAAKAYTNGRTLHSLYWRDYINVSRETYIYVYMYIYQYAYISLGKNIAGAAKVTWQQ